MCGRSGLQECRRKLLSKLLRGLFKEKKQGNTRSSNFYLTFPYRNNFRWTKLKLNNDVQGIDINIFQCIFIWGTVNSAVPNSNSKDFFCNPGQFVGRNIPKQMWAKQMWTAPLITGQKDISFENLKTRCSVGQTCKMEGGKPVCVKSP